MDSGHAISADLPLWPLLGRTLLYVIGMLLVIPAPWVATGFYRWFASRMQVPGRPNFSFTGQVGDIWWVFGARWPCWAWSAPTTPPHQIVAVVLQAVLSWMVLRWVVSNLASNGQKIRPPSTAIVLGYIGWQILTLVSFITIIGWAWVCHRLDPLDLPQHQRRAARDRVQRHRLEVSVAHDRAGARSAALIIPIPWVLRWYCALVRLAIRAGAPHGAAYA